MDENAVIDDGMSTNALKPDYKLHHARSIHLAAILGSALAASILMFQNSKRMGEPAKASTHLIFGVVTFVAFVAISILLPIEMPGIVITLLQAAVVAFYFNKQQESLVEEILAKGAEAESRWLAVGVSVLIGVIFLAVLFLLTYSGLIAFDEI